MLPKTVVISVTGIATAMVVRSPLKILPSLKICTYQLNVKPVSGNAMRLDELRENNPMRRIGR
jgi:hypothetical protein